MRPLRACLFLIAILTSLRGNAQCPSDKYQWDLSLSYGPIAPGLDNVSADGDGSKTVTPSPYTTFLTVRYFIFNRLAIGGAVGMGNQKGNFTPNGATEPAGTYSFTSTTAAFELYYIYFFRKYMEVYTFAGAGPATSKESTTSGISSGYTNTGMIRGQITPIGIRAGGRMGGYAELGYGYKGIVNLGVSFKLGPSCWWKNDFR